MAWVGEGGGNLHCACKHAGEHSSVAGSVLDFPLDCCLGGRAVWRILVSLVPVQVKLPASHRRGGRSGLDG